MRRKARIALAFSLSVLIFSFGAVHAEPFGPIVAWGSMVNVDDAKLSNLVAIACGTYHNFGLRSDGSVVAWGRNDWGQCNVLSPNADFAAIACGVSHSLGLKNDGTIVAWGDNSNHQCDVPLPNADYIAIAGGCWHSLGVKRKSSVAVVFGNFSASKKQRAIVLEWDATATGGAQRLQDLSCRIGRPSDVHN